MKQTVFNNKDITEFEKILKTVNADKIFLICDQGSFVVSGARKFMEKKIDIETATIFGEFSSNPQLDDLKKGIALFKKREYEMIIAIGGGSTIDMAKLIGFFANQENSIEDIVLNKASVEKMKTPLVAIPTTAGTGAEATHFAVLYIDKTKYSVANEMILPDYVYLSSEFIESASPYLKACTGADTFCQAVEAAWSVNSNSESEKYALEAIKLAWKYLPEFVNSTSKTVSDFMQEAAYLAGKAINITKTTAPHALSYAFTSYYYIPHGHAVALTLPFFFDYNYHVSNDDCMDERGSERVRMRIQNVLSVLGIDIADAYNEIIKFFKIIGLETDIAKLIENFDIEIVTDNVNFERLNNNPRKVTKDSISEIFTKK